MVYVATNDALLETNTHIAKHTLSDVSHDRWMNALFREFAEEYILLMTETSARVYVCSVWMLPINISSDDQCFSIFFNVLKISQLVEIDA